MIPIHFSAIIHPVTTDPSTGEKRRGPIYERRGIGGIATDTLQQQMANAYVTHAQQTPVTPGNVEAILDGLAAILVYGAGERAYALTGFDARQVQKLLKNDAPLLRKVANLTALRADLAELKVETAGYLSLEQTNLEQVIQRAEDAVKQQGQAVVQAYIDTQADRVEEVTELPKPQKGSHVPKRFTPELGNLLYLIA